MKKTFLSLALIASMAALPLAATAHGYGGWHGGWHGGGYNRGGGWAPFAAGALVGAVAVNAYRPYYNTYRAYAPQGAYLCPANGLYFPQTQGCPMPWQFVPY